METKHVLPDVMHCERHSMIYPILLPKIYNLDLTMGKHQKTTGFVSKKKINAGCLRTVNPACTL